VRLVSLPGSLAEGIPGTTGGIEHGRAAIENAMREEALAQVEPDPLDWMSAGA
jgi:hypothetical protein